MKLNLKPIHFIRPIIFLGLLLLNSFVFKSPIIGTSIGLILIYFYGYNVGHYFFVKLEDVYQRLYGMLLFVLTNSIILWFCFYVYQVNLLAFFTILSILMIVIELNSETDKKVSPYSILRLRDYFWNMKPKVILGLYVITWLYLLTRLFEMRTDKLIDSPWNLLGLSILPVFAVATFLLVLVLLRNKLQKYSILFISLHSFLMVSLAAIVYRIGFGYDPFLHLATINELIAKGSILPKSLYYIGEYTIVSFLHFITLVDTEALNTWLLPIAFVLFVPLTIYLGLTMGLRLKKAYAITASLAFLALPLTIFVNTTPQGITNLLVLLVIFLSFLPKNLLPKFLLLFLAFATCTVHPLYGVPIGLFALYKTADLFKSRIPKYLLKSFSALIALVAFPALFVMNSVMNGFKIGFGYFPNIPTLWQNISQNIFTTDMAFVYGQNVNAIFLILFVLGLILAIKNKMFKQLWPYLLFGTIFLINFVVMSNFVNFEFTTNQNQTLFNGRIITLAFYFLMPFVIYLFYSLLASSYKNKSYVLRLVTFLILIMMITFSWYFTYPIKNDYFDSKQFNITQGDIDTVHIIENKAKGPYAVLGNQMLAAAAIKELGFAQYFQDQFYYSIPDDSEKSLYSQYQKMVFEKPSIEAINQARQITGTTEIYFVVSEYWIDVEKIVPEVKKFATDYFYTPDQANHIFYFSL